MIVLKSEFYYFIESIDYCYNTLPLQHVREFVHFFSILENNFSRLISVVLILIMCLIPIIVNLIVR